MTPKKFEQGNEIEIVNLNSGEVEPAVITATTCDNFHDFSGVIVRFDDGTYQECDKEFLT